MKKSRVEFIKRAHESACSEWKSEIEKEFPKLFVKEDYKVGDWCFAGTSLIHIYEFDRCGDPRIYRVDGSKSNFFFLDIDRKATDKEVETALIKEAKKRGFKKGTTIKKLLEFNMGSLSGDKTTCEDKTFMYNNNSMLFVGNLMIFWKGKWATIVETITKEQAEKELGKTIIS